MGLRLRLIFPSLDEKDHPELDKQVDSPAPALILDIGDLASTFGVTREEITENFAKLF